MLIDLIKNIPEEVKSKSIDLLVKIASSNEQELETLSMMEKSGLIDKLNELPEDKRKKTIEIMGSVIDKRKNMEVVKPSRIEKQKLEIHSKELEDR